MGKKKGGGVSFSHAEGGYKMLRGSFNTGNCFSHTEGGRKMFSPCTKEGRKDVILS